MNVGQQAFCGVRLGRALLFCLAVAMLAALPAKAGVLGDSGRFAVFDAAAVRQAEQVVAAAEHGQYSAKDILRSKAILAYHNGQWAEALPLWQKVLQGEPEDPKAGGFLPCEQTLAVKSDDSKALFAAGLAAHHLMEEAPGDSQKGGSPKTCLQCIALTYYNKLSEMPQADAGLRARAVVNGYATYGWDSNQLLDALKALSKLGDSQGVQEARVWAAEDLILTDAKILKPDEVRKIIEDRDAKADAESVKERCAKLGESLLRTYRNTPAALDILDHITKPDQGWTVFEAWSLVDALGILDDSEKLRELRAEVAAKLVKAAGNDWQTAQAIFDDMARLGDSDAVKGWRARAAESLIADKQSEKDARKIFDAMAADSGNSPMAKSALAEAAVAMIRNHYVYRGDNQLEAGRKLFLSMSRLGDAQDVRQWRAVAAKDLIAAYVNEGKTAEARKIFDAMSGLGNLEEGADCRAEAQASLVYGYARHKQLHAAQAVFDAMPKHGDARAARARVGTALSLITAYSNAQKLAEARKLFDALPEPGESDDAKFKYAIAAADLINAYGKAGETSKARTIFDAMAHFGDSENVKERRADAAAHLIAAYCDAKKSAEARKIFDSMPVLARDTDSVAHAWAAANLANAYCTSKKFTEAREILSATGFGAEDLGRLGKSIQEQCANMSKLVKSLDPKAQEPDD